MASYICHDGRSIRSVTSTLPEGAAGDSCLYVPENLDADDLFDNYEVRDNQLVLKTRPSLRVAMVSVYSIRCGISTYSEWLWNAMVEHVEDYRIFAEMEDAETTEENHHLVRCWRRGQPLHGLVDAIKAYDPDVVFVQHEYGNFPVARHWLSFLSALSQYRVVTTLHSVYSHMDKTVCEAACPEIIVHTEAARHMLVEGKQVPGNVYVVPHGCHTGEDNSRLWNIYNSDHTLVQFGFGFQYKGWENSLELVSKLKDSYPDVFYTGLFSQAYQNTHNAYYQKLQRLVDDLGIREQSALIKGFQSDVSLDAYLRTNRVAVFPYIHNGEHTVLGCSGAARLAMSKGLPVLASDVPLFDDIRGVAQVVPVEYMPDVVKMLFEDPGVVAAQLERQNQFLALNSWDATAQRYLAIVS